MPARVETDFDALKDISAGLNAAYSVTASTGSPQLSLNRF
jgi:hypothetical protein